MSNLSDVDGFRRPLSGGWEYKNADFNAEVGGKYQVDTTGGVVTATLPDGIIAGDPEILIADAKLTWGINSCLIAPAASGLGDTINGVAASYDANVVGGRLSVVPIDAGYGVSIK